MACCCVKAGVICDAYRGLANMSTAVDLLAMALLLVSHGGGGEDDGNRGVEDDDVARCFPLSVKVARGPGADEVVWPFAPRHPPASTQWRRHI
jgi:hypothetical protein